jgi:hypothetical protein
VAENNLIETNLKKMPPPPDMESVINGGDGCAGAGAEKNR